MDVSYYLIVTAFVVYVGIVQYTDTHRERASTLLLSNTEC